MKRSNPRVIFEDLTSSPKIRVVESTCEREQADFQSVGQYPPGGRDSFLRPYREISVEVATVNHSMGEPAWQVIGTAIGTAK